MAQEYTFDADAEADTETLLRFFAEATGADRTFKGTTFREGMYVTPRRATDENRNPLTEVAGFRHRITATFHMNNLAGAETEDHNTAIMVRSVLQFFERFGGRGVLLHNGERVILQRLTEQVVFDSDWEDWFDNEQVLPVRAGYPMEPLPQPFL